MEQLAIKVNEINEQLDPDYKGKTVQEFVFDRLVDNIQELQKRVIETDFDKTNGEIRIQCKSFNNAQNPGGGQLFKVNIERVDGSLGKYEFQGVDLNTLLRGSAEIIYALAARVQILDQQMSAKASRRRKRNPI